MMSLHGIPGLLTITLLFTAILLLPPPMHHHAVASGNNLPETPFYVSWILHYHQPLYNENGSLIELLEKPGRPSWLDNVWLSRVNIYRGRVAEAALACPGNCTIQVDLTGTLIQQLDELEKHGWYNGAYDGWRDKWVNAACTLNPAGYPKLSFLVSSYHHVIYPLVQRLGEDLFIDEVKMHNDTLHRSFGCGVDQGFFPIEESFTPEMIPVLKKLGFQWTVVDSLHVLRATRGYSGDYEPAPNKYDVRNPDPGLWDWGLSPELVFRPHMVEYNGSRIIVFVRYREISQAGMSGISADYLIQVIRHFQQYNTDPRRPFIMVIVHDGENGFPGHNDGYDFYEVFLRDFFNKITGDPSLSFIRVIGLTQYLDGIYNPLNDTEYTYSRIWVEPGSWETMSTWGEPYFPQWNWPEPTSPDQERWWLVARALSYYRHAYSIVEKHGLWSIYNDTLQAAWRSIIVSLTSDYYYWDGDAWWDRKVPRLLSRVIANLSLITRAYPDEYGPMAMYTWRSPYNPGSTVEIYFHAEDPSGIANATVTLYSTGGAVAAEAIRVSETCFRATIPLSEAAVHMVRINVIDTEGNPVSVYARSFYGGTGATQYYVMNGEVDGSAALFYENTSNYYVQHLWVDLHDDLLYVATDGSGGDVFIFISTSLGNATPPPWVKRGYVASYDYYLACEADNGWTGWFSRGDALLSGKWLGSARGDVLEGYINLTKIYGRVPEKLYITAAVYESPDGGRLVEVLVHDNGDSDIGSSEYAVLDTTGTSPPPPIPEPAVSLAVLGLAVSIALALWVFRHVYPREPST